MLNNTRVTINFTINEQIGRTLMSVYRKVNLIVLLQSLRSLTSLACIVIYV